MIHLLLVQITVEGHRDIADKNAAEGSHANFRGIENDEAFVACFLQPLQFRREIFVEINGKLEFG